MLTRLYDWLNVPPGALVKPKDPLEYLDKLRFHQRVKIGRRLRVGPDERGSQIWTDGACSGNPGPGGWGAILSYGEREKELCGGEPLTTNNRMELMAAIAALEALKRPCAVDLHTDFAVFAAGRHRLAAHLEAQRLAHRRPQAGQERGPLAAARRRRCATRSNGSGSRAMRATN